MKVKLCTSVYAEMHRLIINLLRGHSSLGKKVGGWGQKVAILLTYSSIYADVGGWA